MEAKELLRLLKNLTALTLLIANLCYAECGEWCAKTPVTPSTSNTLELLVFVSFAMPKQSLKLWAEQAARINAKMVIRGFVENSLLKTTAKTQEVFGEKPKAELLVDPESFERFNIQMVSAVVVTEPMQCVQDNCSIPIFDVVYGDTSLGSALERLANQGSDQIKPNVRTLLEKLRDPHD